MKLTFAHTAEVNKESASTDQRDDSDRVHIYSITESDVTLCLKHLGSYILLDDRSDAPKKQIRPFRIAMRVMTY